MLARVSAALVGFGLALVGLYLRVLHTWNASHHDGAFVNAWDPDTFYHLRRTLWAARHGTPLVADPHAAAPSGLLCAWSDALEQLTLSLHRGVFGADPDIEGTALMVPLFIAVATLAAAVALYRGSGVAGLLGFAAVALGRDAVRVTAYGTFDHHGLELLAFVLALFAIRVASPEAEDDGARAPQAISALGLVVFGLGVAVADGGYILFGVATVAAVARPSVGLAALVCGAAVGVATVAGLDAARGLARTVTPLTAVGVALVGAGAAVWRAGLGPKPLGVGVAVGGVVAAAPGVLHVLTLLSPAGHDVTAYISEAQALWAVTTTERIAIYVFGMVFAATPWLRRPWDALRVSVVVAGLVGILQAKYGFFLPVCLGWVAAEAAARFQGPARAAVVVVAVGVLALEAADVVRRSPSAVAPEDLALARVSAALDQTAPPIDVFAADEPPWTILVRPSLGAQTLYWTRRPVTSLPFWGAESTAAQFRDSLHTLLSAPSADVDDALARLKVRYVLVDDVRMASPRARAIAADRGVDMDQTLWARLSAGDPPPGFRLVARDGIPGRTVHAYEWTEAR